MFKMSTPQDYLNSLQIAYEESTNSVTIHRCSFEWMIARIRQLENALEVIKNDKWAAEGQFKYLDMQIDEWCKQELSRMPEETEC